MFDLKTVKAAFFDAAKVQDAIDRGTAKTLSKFGAFVRQRARSSIKKRKKSSPPGQPPSSHEGSLKRLIFFALDQETQSLVVGPVPFRRGEAPPLLEHGGEITRAMGKGGRVRRRTYRGNAFMAPAAKAEASKFKDLLKGMVK